LSSKIFHQVIIIYFQVEKIRNMRKPRKNESMQARHWEGNTVSSPLSQDHREWERGKGLRVATVSEE
jgi:hypothetical protein